MKGKDLQFIENVSCLISQLLRIMQTKTPFRALFNSFLQVTVDSATLKNSYLIQFVYAKLYTEPNTENNLFVNVVLNFIIKH